MLEKDQSNANSKIKEIAVSEKIKMPDSMLPEQKKYTNHRQTLKGKEFDKVFLAMIIDDHTKDIAEFKEAAARNENKKVKAYGSVYKIRSLHTRYCNFYL